MVLITTACIVYALFVSDRLIDPYQGEIPRAGNGVIDAISPTDRTHSIKNTVRQNITRLSPREPVLGGTFFVTDIRIIGTNGTVWYEDGHHAYVADFSYTQDAQRRNTITTFLIRT